MYNLENIISGLMERKDVEIKDIPNIDLYMDQVLTLFETYFPYNEKEQKLTKTMINNYVKGKILSPAVRKKYNREHILMIIMICMLKRSLSLSEIKDVITDDIERVYSDFLSRKEEMNSVIMPEIGKIISLADNESDDDSEKKLLDVMLLSYYSNILSEAAREIIRDEKNNG